MDLIQTHDVMTALEEPKLAVSLNEGLPVARARVTRRTVALQLPLFYNTNRLGIRMPVGFGKLRETFRELKCQFSSGFNVSARLGWCKEDGVWDLHLHIDLDTEMTPDLESFLIWWREVLRVRFDQRSIYMTLSSPISWIEA